MPDSCSDPYIIPVGLDFLFSVNLRNLVLVPDFWAGTPVRVLLSLWFYAPPRPSSRPSHLIKCYPVDPALALALEKAYHEIKPWESSYEAELQSALRVGVSAEAKLRVPLIREAGQGLECIFQDAETARVYSTGIVGSMGKSFLSSGKAHGGGQVVLRGWDAVRAWKKKKAAVDGDEGHRTPTKRETSASETDDGEASPVPRSRTTSSSSPLKPSQAPPGFFSALKTKIGVVAAVVEGASEEELVETDGNDTQEAMAGPRKRKDGENEVDEDVEKVGEVDELVLVIHGIGQKVRGGLKVALRRCETDEDSPSAARRHLQVSLLRPRRQRSSNELHHPFDLVHRPSHPLEASSVHPRSVADRPRVRGRTGQWSRSGGRELGKSVQPRGVCTFVAFSGYDKLTTWIAASRSRTAFPSFARSSTGSFSTFLSTSHRTRRR